MKALTRILAPALCLALLPLAALAQDNEPAAGKTLDQLLREVQQGRTRDQQMIREREAEFQKRKDDQAKLLSAAKAEKDRQEKMSEELEASFQQNELDIAALQDQLRQRLGNLGELFGLVRQVAGDTRSVIEGSMTNVQIPGRAVPLNELAQSKELPAIDELRTLWYELQREMTLTGTATRFQTNVVGTDGTKEPREVTRVGAFTAVSDGEFLTYEVNTQELKELQRQPPSRFTRTASSYEGASGEYADMVVDPSRGQILGLVVDAPTPRERVAQGGAVGYVILSMGAIGVALAIFLFVSLTGIGSRIRRQVKADKADPGNPLGRIMAAYEENRNADVETVELKLDEAVLREVPKLERGLTTVKVFSVLAPLLGLLGTVIGMIETFQMITLFGTGDPKMMASGISVALVTTMLGLMVAIPLTLLHSFLNDRSRGLVEILEEQAAGMIARRAEEAEKLSA